MRGAHAEWVAKDPDRNWVCRIVRRMNQRTRRTQQACRLVQTFVHAPLARGISRRSAPGEDEDS
jgi:hypothetical protein